MSELSSQGGGKDAMTLWDFSRGRREENSLAWAWSGHGPVSGI